MLKIYFCLVLFISFNCLAAQDVCKKINAQDLQKFGLRYLDHLEYDINEQDIPLIIEKNPTLRFDPNLYANDINKHYQAPVYIAYINNQVNHGVYAAEDIKAGQMIGEYTGIVRKVNFSKVATDYDYVWGFPPPTKLVIDAKDSGNFTRFINHSNNHNVDMIYVLINNRWHLAYVANKNIKKDQQLLANYGSSYWRGRGIKPHNLK